MTNDNTKGTVFVILYILDDPCNDRITIDITIDLLILIKAVNSKGALRQVGVWKDAFTRLSERNLRRAQEMKMISHQNKCVRDHHPAKSIFCESICEHFPNLI